MDKLLKPCPLCGAIEDNLSCPKCRQRKGYRDMQARHEKLRRTSCCDCGNELVPGMRKCAKYLDAATQEREGKRPTLLPPHLREIIRAAKQEKRMQRKKKEP
jgi:hypothetical protein